VNFVYVDNSNVWIEGMRVAAVARGLAPSIRVAQQSSITGEWRMDFGRLLHFAGGNRSNIGRAVLYGSKPPENDSLWEAARAEGFEITVYDRNAAGREKKIDTSIATDIVADSYERMKRDQDEVTLIAGDADYVPTCEQLRGRGFKFYVLFWNHASRELQGACTRFTPLDQHLQYLLRVTPPVGCSHAGRSAW
jgi:uncharacterized LabA/DUF88 family protein